MAKDQNMTNQNTAADQGTQPQQDTTSANNLRVLADMHRKEHVQSLKEMPDRDLCEMIRAHFASHPTLPGEKAMKDQANQLIALSDSMRVEQEEARKEYTQALLAAKLDPEKYAQLSQNPFIEEEKPLLSEKEKEDLAARFAQTRIRETSLKEGNYYLDFRHFDPSELSRTNIAVVDQPYGAPVNVDRIDVELQKNDAGDVYVMAMQQDGGFRMVGTLPDKFLANNPMNVDSCKAELQIADYSNGKLKNLSARVVVDTDLMSDDVVDLDEDMLSGLDKGVNMEQ